ncbi:hypothetical protein [Pseudomonas sp. Irchel 3E13]|uniref:hypothetical protein n=1 Tax=Pseudomonas sp. Irchel 3E13 TaxID=2008975 RepID=UPI000BA492DF|nr:hypothetical protein [Pseudomonas sp. Irchel 3E13]
MQHYYKSKDATVLAIIQEYFQARAQFQQQLLELGKVFGGAAASMRDLDSHYAGGIKLSDDGALDVHWRRPDDHGFRSLRHNARIQKGTSKEDRAQIRAQHESLHAQWDKHCPPRLDITPYWDRLGVNTGNLWLSGGVKFEHQGTAYFMLGFDINQARYEKALAEDKPTSGWIIGATEILPSEYETARLAKVGGSA